MTPGPSYLTQLRDGLTLLCDGSGQLNQSHNGEPAADSQADKDRAEVGSDELVDGAWYLGGLLLDFGAQHVSALTKILVEPVEVIVCWTCVRSMLESSALSAWFLDPSIDARTRVARVFAYRYAGLRQQLTYARTSGAGPVEIQSASDRIDKVEKDALAVGFRKVQDRNGRRIGIGTKMPSTTDLIALVLDRGVDYRICSAVAHGHHWAIHQLGYQTVDGEADVDGLRTTRLETSTDIAWIALLGVRAFTALARPLWNQCGYGGWEVSKLDELLDNAADKLEMSKAIRFWRS